MVEMRLLLLLLLLEQRWGLQLNHPAGRWQPWQRGSQSVGARVANAGYGLHRHAVASATDGVAEEVAGGPGHERYDAPTLANASLW